MNHTQLQRGQTDHHRGSYNDHVHVTSIPGNHKCWIGHSSKGGEKLLIGSVSQVLRVPPRDRGSHYYSLMVMDTAFFPWLLRSFSQMLPERVLNPCPPAHQSMAGNSIHAWQRQPNNHLLATHVLCPRRNLEVSAVVTPCISWRAISFFHLFSNSLALSLPLCFSGPNTSFQLA